MPKKEKGDKLNLSYGTVLLYLKGKKLGLMGELERKLGLKQGNCQKSLRRSFENLADNWRL